MKKNLAVVFSSFVFVLFISGVSHAILFSDYQALNQTLGGGLYSYTYTHNTPGDFEVPYDTVNSASLTINARDVTGLLGLGDDTVWAECIIQGTLNMESGHTEWVWGIIPKYVIDDPNSTTTFNLDNFIDVFTFGWDTGDPLHITVAGLECGSLTLIGSEFTLDYENGSAPVPEPATLLLLGTGLLGAAGLRRRNRS